MEITQQTSLAGVQSIDGTNATQLRRMEVNRRAVAAVCWSLTGLAPRGNERPLPVTNSMAQASSSRVSAIDILDRFARMLLVSMPMPLNTFCYALNRYCRAFVKDRYG